MLEFIQEKEQKKQKEETRAKLKKAFKVVHTIQKFKTVAKPVVNPENLHGNLKNTSEDPDLIKEKRI